MSGAISLEKGRKKMYFLPINRCLTYFAHADLGQADNNQHSEQWFVQYTEHHPNVENSSESSPNK
jgi:hypothetical protein